jgi:hypothetical protein
MRLQKEAKPQAARVYKIDSARRAPFPVPVGGEPAAVLVPELEEGPLEDEELLLPVEVGAGVAREYF